MSRKITRYCSLKDRIGKQVYAYFKKGKKNAKVLCNVDLQGTSEVVLVPVDVTERNKMGACIDFWTFSVHPDWPHTTEWHNSLLKSCSAVGHSIHRKPKVVEKKFFKCTVDGQEWIFTAGEEHKCDFSLDGVRHKGPWTVVLEKNDRDASHNSYYLLHNSSACDGGHHKLVKKTKYKYAWWLCDEGETPHYLLKPLTDVSVDSEGIKFCGFEVEKKQTRPVAIKGSYRMVCVRGEWMLHKSSDKSWYLLSNDPCADGGRPTKEKDMQGYQYSWYMGEDLTHNDYTLVNAKVEPSEVQAPATTECSSKDPLERIADALDRIAAYLAK